MPSAFFREQAASCYVQAFPQGYKIREKASTISENDESDKTWERALAAGTSA